MMKILKYGAATLLCMLAAACDDSDVFYTTSYPVVRIEAEVTGPVPEPEPEPEPEPASVVGTRTGEEETDPVLEQIGAEIVAAAPVQAGGNYTLYFSQYNGGRARIDTATDAGTLTGTFTKEPGAADILFVCPDPALEYICTLSNYTAEDGRSRVVFTVDLTAHYQALYPDAGITRAVRREYTSANAH